MITGRGDNLPSPLSYTKSLIFVVGDIGVRYLGVNSNSDMNKACDLPAKNIYFFRDWCVYLKKKGGGAGGTNRE